MTTAIEEKDEWLDYRAAAAMMHRPVNYLRLRWPDGSYKYWPEIERWQPGGRGTRLYVRRESVEAWIERSRTPAPSPIKREFNGVGYESALPTLMRLGAYGTMKSLGLAAPTTKPNTRANKAKKGDDNGQTQTNRNRH
jgi:hypothetical protein